MLERARRVVRGKMHARVAYELSRSLVHAAPPGRLGVDAVEVVLARAGHLGARAARALGCDVRALGHRSFSFYLCETFDVRVCYYNYLPAPAARPPDYKRPFLLEREQIYFNLNRMQKLPKK